MIPRKFLFLSIFFFNSLRSKFKLSGFISVKIGFELLNNIALAVEAKETGEVIKSIFFFCTACIAICKPEVQLLTATAYFTLSNLQTAFSNLLIMGP